MRAVGELGNVNEFFEYVSKCASETFSAEVCCWITSDGRENKTYLTNTQ
jgi:hypothetical protein